MDWYYNINDRNLMDDRGGYELFPDDGNILYTITQWFPRMAVYDDHEGWQHKQFLGRGEFALTFGNYEVEITVPADHIVASTGTLQNPEAVLTTAQRDLLEQSKTADKPVIIVSQAKPSARKSSGPKTPKPGSTTPTACGTSPSAVRASTSGTPWAWTSTGAP